MGNRSGFSSLTPFQGYTCFGGIYKLMPVSNLHVICYIQQAVWSKALNERE